MRKVLIRCGGCCGWWCSGRARGAPSLAQDCHNHASFGGMRIDWLRYGELEFPCTHMLQFILCIASFAPNTLPGVYGNNQYFFDAARGMWTAWRTTTMACKTRRTGRMSNCSVMASPRGCNTMTWRGARYSPKNVCLFTEFDKLLDKPLYM
ncbi:hypothetical protein D1007_35449 [Hordeum vulgare]|nr:hypothetical protein D1007_35449 [Hordeum vulgare]